ncbi:MAG: hypothetical protein ABJ000_05185 [Saccharospirillum sp.]|uniref:hypothetical protein n=1 Tax=Saccharospirillum sp. TaxID=2033801 RepID=UPI003297AA1E
MRYVIGILLPVLAQALFVMIVIAMNTGNGSWAGLAALLLGMFAIPATGLANFIYLRSRRDRPILSVIVPCFLIAFVMPFLLIILLMVG